MPYRSKPAVLPRVAVAVVAGMISCRAARASLLFDNITGIENGSANGYIYTGSADTFTGGGYVLPTGTTDVTGFDLLATNASSTTFKDIKINLYIWGTVNTTGTVNATTPAFGDELGFVSLVVPGSLPPGNDFRVEDGEPGATGAISLAKPLQLNGTTIIGLSFNIQGTTNGTTYSTFAGLTTYISSDAPPTAGQNLFVNAMYLAANGETNGNFTGGPYQFGGLTNQNIGVRVFGDVAASPNWNTSTGGAWETATNWSTNAVPTSSTDALFNLSSAGYSVTISSADVCKDLYVQSDKVTLNLSAGTAPGTRLNLSAGTVGIGGNGGTGVLTIGSGVNVVSAGAVSVAAGSSLVISSGGELRASTLSIAGTTDAWTGKIDIGTTALDLPAGSLATVTNQVKQGYNAAGGGNWNGSGGITSSAAAGNSTHRLAVGVIVNNNGIGTPLYGTGGTLGNFGGNSPALNDVLIRETWFGDANLNGKVDGTDYSLIDNGCLNHLTGWYNGDFNYDGVINGSDYTLIDNAFNTQGAILIPTAELAQTAGEPSSVPEPAEIATPGFVALFIYRCFFCGRLNRRSLTH